MHADVLVQALPYIQAFREQTFVVKYGGSAMRERSLRGGVVRVDAGILSLVTAAGYGPVVCSVGTDAGHRPLNVNADEAAGAIAGAVGASKLILLTDTPGVLADKDKPESHIAHLSRAEA